MDRIAEETLTDPTDDAPPARGTSEQWSRPPLALVGVGVLAVVVGLLFVPPDKTLGDNVRLVLFHGAITWTGIVMAAAAGALGVAQLVTGRPAPERQWRALSLAALFWVASLAISFPVMLRTWGGVPWNEPKLLMSAQVVTLLLVAWAVSLVVGRPRVTAGLALVACAVMATLLAVTPGAFHPDNPIVASGDPRFIGTFFAIAAGLVGCATGLIFASRASR